MSAQEAIKQAWSKYPEVVVAFTELSPNDKKPRIKKVAKNVMRVFVKNRINRGQIVYVFRGALEATVTYKKGQSLETAFENGHLDDAMVLPSKHMSHYCTNCRDFTVTLYFSQMDRRLKCLDCLKSEKAQLKDGASHA